MTAIIDAHHHIWRPADLPWLDGPMQPRIFGPYEPIRRDYPIDEYLADLAGTGVTIRLRARQLAKDRFEDEVAYVQQAADETGYPQAIVGYADFLRDDVRPQLDRLSKYPGMRGLRMQVQWHENPQYQLRGRAPTSRATRHCRRTSRSLADYGWSFDLQVFAGQMPGAAELADALPKVTFVLQHAGMLEDLSPQAGHEWRNGMRELASRPNVVSQAVGARAPSSTETIPAHIAAVVHETIDIFGPERCLFGSNFPIEKLWTGYSDLSPRTGARSNRSVKRRRVPHSMTRRQEFIGSIDLGHISTRAGRNSMALEIKILDYGDIELESSFLVLGRDCGRTRRVPVLGFLVLGGTWPVVIDTGYRSNQIMETLGMRGLQSPREHDREPTQETRPAARRRALRAAYPSAHRPRRQGRSVPHEHGGRDQSPRAGIFGVRPDASAISCGRHQASDRPAAHQGRAALSRSGNHRAGRIDARV